MDQERVDRDRLKEVHRSEQSESRVNEDFIEWLRSWGPTVLLTLLLGLTAYLLLVQWKQRSQRHEQEAWVAFAEAQSSDLPSAYESVADQYPDVGRLGVLARLRAAHRLLRAVQSGVPIDAIDIAADTPPTLTEEEREHYLSRADALYAQIETMDDGTVGMSLHVVNALNGRAAIAEARGEIDEARRLYDRAAARAEVHFPALSEQARTRAESAEQFATAIALATEDAAEGDADDSELKPVIIEPSLRELILPDSAPMASGSSGPNLPSTLGGSGGVPPISIQPR